MYYLDKAKKGQDVALALLQLVPEEHRPAAAALIAQVVNAGVRSAPRVQHTVRRNIVETVCKKLPVKIGMVQVKKEGYAKPWNCLTITPLAENKVYEATVEGAEDDDE